MQRKMHVDPAEAERVLYGFAYASGDRPGQPELPSVVAQVAGGVKSNGVAPSPGQHSAHAGRAPPAGPTGRQSSGGVPRPGTSTEATRGTTPLPGHLQLSEQLRDRVRHALEVLERALNEYGVDGVSISFNGGKDCTVLLHLFVAVCSRLGLFRRDASSETGPLLATDGKPLRIRTLYVTYRNPFPEVEEFVATCVSLYSLDIRRASGGIKAGLQSFLESFPQVRSVVMGTRRTDPYSEHLKDFHMTDADWPQVMRVNPILDWDYGNVWSFLLLFNVPYCSIYDKGYTSLGDIDNTVPNPNLIRSGEEGSKEAKFYPAFVLQDSSKERDGRLKR